MSNLLEKRRIFVVDDEEIVATSLAALLETFGFNAIAFNHPLKALEAGRSQSPDLLISDVMMPVLNGIELAVELLRVCPECKVLLLSGQAATEDLLEAAHAGGNEFELIGKPVHPSDLVRKIRERFGAN